MRRIAVLSVCAALAACSGGANLTPETHSVAPADTVTSLGRHKIQHVIVVIQENRTLDNLFHALPGADTASVGLTHTGQTVALTPGPLEEPYDLGHSHANFETEYDGGKNDGFDEVPTSPQSTATAPYQYVYQSEVQPYFDIAKEFVLGDHTFASQNGPSFPGHEYLIAGQAAGADDDPSDIEPWGCDAPSGTTVPVYNSDGSTSNVFPCFDYQTLGDLLDNARVSWRYYTTAGTTNLQQEMMPDPYDAVRHIRYGPDWQHDTVTPSTQVLNDIASGNLAAVSWVNSPADASDHPQLNDGRGPSWVASIVNAVGQSAYYNNTVILVTWDDWGGWYDHVVPKEYGILGTGFRVPLLVVSKWSKHGYVSKTTHEFGSILRFIEGVYGLPSLGTRDVVSDDLVDCFNFNQTPAPFKPITLNMPLNITTLQSDTRANDNY
ncbi:MAG TPA: alkaline phosphatase family protein [Candidatus Baltobacteraceae bacterium]|nr:alkaline phosphatase family protein [Candidatus Baltobacteraceae bacterium]